MVDHTRHAARRKGHADGSVVLIQRMHLAAECDDGAFDLDVAALVARRELVSRAFIADVGCELHVCFHRALLEKDDPKTTLGGACRGGLDVAQLRAS